MTESNRCPACGRAIHPGDRFCAACGQQLGEPGFVPPAAPAPSSVSTGASGPGAAGGWPDVPPATADAAWMPPGRAATVAAVVAGGRGGAEAGTAAESVRLLGAETPDASGRDADAGQSAAGYPGDPHAPARGEDATAADTPDVGTGIGTGTGTTTATGWGLAPAAPSLIVPASEAAPRSENTALGRSTAAGDDDANWFAATRPSTLVAWGLIATVGGLLLGAIGQVDPTDTLVIFAFLIVPLGLLLLPLALLCWVVQKATGRR